MNHFLLMIGAMGLAGLVGGLTNGLGLKKDKVWPWREFFEHLAWSACASFSVPLFLKILSSDLIEKAGFWNSEFLEFFGLCLVAALFSKKFVRSLSDRLINDLKDKQEQTQEEVKNLKEDVDVVSSAKTEPSEPEEKKMKTFSFGSVSDSSPDPDAKKVLKALGNNKYVWRTSTGIARETGMAAGEVLKILDLLASQQLVVARRDQDRWGLTSKGRDALG